MFGLAIRITIEPAPGKQKIVRLEVLEDSLMACRDPMFKVVDWILMKFLEITPWFCY